jgi:hypothetical protein
VLFAYVLGRLMPISRDDRIAGPGEQGGNGADYVSVFVLLLVYKRVPWNEKGMKLLGDVFDGRWLPSICEELLHPPVVLFSGQILQVVGMEREIGRSPVRGDD